MQQAVVAGGLHPLEAKKLLAEELTARMHGQEQARAARQEFEAVFTKRDLPEQIPEITLTGEQLGLAESMRQAGLVATNSEGLRMIEQKAVLVDHVRVEDKRTVLASGQRYLIQVGKRRFAYVKIIER